MLRPAVLIRTIALAIVLVMLAPVAMANDKPFSIVGAGVGPSGLPLPGEPPRFHWVVGVATQLGLHYGEGTVQTFSAVPDFANGVINGTFGSGSPFVFRGANGDKLACYYGNTVFGAAEPGTFTLTILEINNDGTLLVQAAWIAEFVAQPNLSTGSFKGVKGSWIMYAYSAPFILGSDDPVVYWWEGEGVLKFPKPKKGK